MSGLEKAGVKMLRQMEKPMDKSQIRQTLDQACTGKLHYLTPVQRSSVVSTHVWCVFQALFIGAFFTFWPGVWENYLVMTFETDGVVDVRTLEQSKSNRKHTMIPWSTPRRTHLCTPSGT